MGHFWIAVLLVLAGLASGVGNPDLANAKTSRVPEGMPGGEAFPKELRARLEKTLINKGPDYVPRTENLNDDRSPIYTNRLLLESSPYLQQHAHNPVNWYPWGDEAFETAAKLDRPVLVSIGYSTCHWCHVMEEESFDNPETAAYLNAHFIAIKVDREARPDVDSIYMAALHALQIHGGWPLNVWMGPDRIPFYGGTYFPPEDRGKRPGFMTALRTITEEYGTNRESYAAKSKRISQLIRNNLAGVHASSSRFPNAGALKKSVSSYARNADRVWGGWGKRPKFPSSMPVRFLLRYQHRTGDKDALALAILALEKMAAGGIHDHVGGGFHRYSTDQRWLVPHFEKMLYDNALLAQDYLDAWQLTGREDFSAVTRDILDYVMREMTAPGGAFYSATDADSLNPHGETEEGWFFTWTPAELDAVLGPERAREVSAYYGVTPKGNFEGRTIFNVTRSSAQVAGELGISEAALLENLSASRKALYKERATRTPPLLDDKILVAWNGLMISAFARAGFALDEERYLEAARNAAQFVLKEMRDGKRLRRVYLTGTADGPAFLEDYAFFIKALLDLYESSPDPIWSAEAIALQGQLDLHYRDDVGGAYFKTADDGEKLIAREKPSRDGVIPSGNSISAMNLLRLYEYTTNLAYMESASMLFSAFYTKLAGGARLSEMLQALDFQLDTPKEIVIVAPPSGEGLDAMLAPLRSTYLPNRVVMIVREGEDLQKHAQHSPLVREKRALRGKVTAYVCENRVCAFPTNSPEEFAKQIGKVNPLEF